MPSYTIPTSSSSPSGTWTSVFSTGAGGGVIDLNGIGYGELLNSQTGEAVSINSITIQPLSSVTYTLEERISQMLQPISFRKLLATGRDRRYIINPTVDPNIASTTLKNVTLGDQKDRFILDGTTRFTYKLLPFATINLQIEYSKLTNYVFGNPELTKRVIELNRKRNEMYEYLGSVARKYVLSKQSLNQLVKGE